MSQPQPKIETKTELLTAEVTAVPDIDREKVLLELAERDRLRAAPTPVAPHAKEYNKKQKKYQRKPKSAVKHKVVAPAAPVISERKFAMLVPVQPAVIREERKMVTETKLKPLHDLPVPVPAVPKPEKKQKTKKVVHLDVFNKKV